MAPDLAPLSTLIGSNYPCLELILMVPKVFEPLKFYCILHMAIKCFGDYLTVNFRGWSGGAKVLGKLPVPRRPTILITVGQGPIALAVGAGGGGLDIFTLIYPFSSFSLSLGDGPI